MASPSISTESARRAVEWLASPATNSTTNMTALIHRTIVKTRRCRSGMSDRKSQHSSMASVCSGRHCVPGPAVHDPDAGGHGDRARDLKGADRLPKKEPCDHDPEDRCAKDEHIHPR